MDVRVHASDHEPFGAVVVEGMALGKPVVPGWSGGPVEIITDGVNGLLARYGDPDALAAAVLRYLADDSLREQVAYAARARAQAFSVQRFGDALGDALRKLSSKAGAVP